MTVEPALSIRDRAVGTGYTVLYHGLGSGGARHERRDLHCESERDDHCRTGVHGRPPIVTAISTAITQHPPFAGVDATSTGATRRLSWVARRRVNFRAEKPQAIHSYWL